MLKSSKIAVVEKIHIFFLKRCMVNDSSNHKTGIQLKDEWAKIAKHELINSNERKLINSPLKVVFYLFFLNRTFLEFIF